MTEKRPFAVKSHDVHLDSEYTKWIAEVKDRYRRAQIKAAVKVNSEQLLFNWQLGRDLVIKKAEEKWGTGVVEQVSLDLKAEFPDVTGFSTTNLWYMKKWYLFYASAETDIEALDSLTGLQENGQKLHQLGGEINYPEKLHQSGGEIEFPPLLSYVPWRHHVEIITKCKSLDEALFYIRKTIENGYSRSALLNVIEADYYHTSGAAITNYSDRLPLPQAQLAQEITKGNYDLGFITLPANYDEKALENALEQNITRFLLELGTGFAFVGRQKEIVVSGKTRKIDLLFYHIRLRCYVVVELKVTVFEPEFAGKLNFYVSAVDELIRAADDNPTIGLLICKDMDRTEVQWSFRNVSTPLGVATYSNVQIANMEAVLPTTEQIAERVRQAEEEFNLSREAAEKEQ